MKKLRYIILFVLFSQVVVAQQNNSMYFMQTLPQNKWLNPAFQANNRLNISGLLVPVFGQVLPAMHFNYGSNALAIDKILQYNAELDSLVLPGFKGYSNKKLFSELRENNHLALENHFNLLSIGYKMDDWYFGLDIHQKINTHFSVGQDFIKFALDGNAGEQFFGKTAHIGNLGIDFTSYTEYAFSVSKAINEKLTVGASAKILMGQANVWAEKTVLDVYTSDQDNYPMTLTADMLVHFTQPMVKVRDAYFDTQADSMVVDTVKRKLNLVKTLFNPQNMGLGLDLGATYRVNEQIELYASITDLGYIRWKDNAQSLSLKGELNWDGYDFQPDMTKDQETIDAHRDSVKNEMIKAFQPNAVAGAYSTSLNPKLYLGGTYQFSDKIRTGLLLRGMFYNHKLYPSLTLSGNFKLTDWFEGMASYSVINNTYNNVGLGFVARLAAFQFFVVSDNVVGVFLPQSTQNVNLRMGINIALGRGLKEDE